MLPTNSAISADWDKPVPGPKKTIILVDGRKGGTGKSTVSMALAEFLRDSTSLTIEAFDLDGNKGTFGVRYSEVATPLGNASVDDLSPIMDRLFAVDGPDLVIVDVGGGDERGHLVDTWLLKSGAGQDVQDGLLDIISLWVVGGTPRSMSLFKDALGTWERSGVPVRATIIANLGQASRFDYVTESADGRQVCDRYHVPVVQFPKLEEEPNQEAEGMRLTFSTYISSTTRGGYTISRSRRQMTRTWLLDAYKMFDKIELLARLTAMFPAVTAHDDVSKPAPQEHPAPAPARPVPVPPASPVAAATTIAPASPPAPPAPVQTVAAPAAQASAVMATSSGAPAPSAVSGGEKKDAEVKTPSEPESPSAAG